MPNSSLNFQFPAGNCKICGTATESEPSHFYRIHQISQGEYFKKYYPRTDLHTGEPIPFKNKDQYFNSDFLSRGNMRSYLETLGKEDVKQYCRKLLYKRITVKNLLYLPCQVELKSIIAPPVSYLNTIFGNYYDLAKELNLINRFIPLKDKIKVKAELKGNVIIDTREKKPLKINFPSIIEKLDYGDYYFTGNEYKTYIERKSLSDLIGTLTTNLERFEREIGRAAQDKANLIVLVEEKFSNCLAFNKLPWVSKKAKSSPEHLFHNIREVIQKYGNIQFLFVDGRKEAVSALNIIFFAEQDVFQYDLQLLYDTNQLIKKNF